MASSNQPPVPTPQAAVFTFISAIRATHTVTNARLSGLHNLPTLQRGVPCEGQVTLLMQTIWGFHCCSFGKGGTLHDQRGGSLQACLKRSPGRTCGKPMVLT